jgi:Fe-S-cluster containining protein
MDCTDCPDPGACCRAFPVSFHVPVETTREEIRQCLRSGKRLLSEVTFDPLPFIPLRPMWHYADSGHHTPDTVVWIYTCPLLDSKGQCSMYESRPDICRAYEPGSTAMCAKFNGSWKGHLYPSEKTETK